MYQDPSVPFETPYGGYYSFDSGIACADGKVFSAETEHSQSQPVTRGWRLHCINGTTGEGIWKILGSATYMGSTIPVAYADGYLTYGSTDGYMYVIGKGKSATTVTTTPAVIANGATVLIQGTILDQSPAQPGAACVSDDSQGTYMEYLHMQMPLDGIFHNVTVTGVPVSLLAVDSNGTEINIGTTTSDVSGSFGYAWTPPDEGLYKIIASFAATESYGSSRAETHLAVVPAPAEITIPEQIVPPDYTMTIVGVGVAVIIAVAAATLILLRKK
jgi:hypothetical protein